MEARDWLAIGGIAAAVTATAAVMMHAPKGVEDISGFGSAGTVLAILWLKDAARQAVGPMPALPDD